MQPKRQAAIIAKIEAYASGGTVDIRKMQAKGYFRLRVGQDRVILDDHGVVIHIISVGPRGGIYKE